jgi:hypothetical protein
MASMLSQHALCLPGLPSNLKDRRICRAGIAPRLSAQAIEILSTAPSQAHQVQIIMDLVSPTRSNTLLSSPQSLDPTTWAKSISVKDKQWFSPVCLLLHKVRAYRLRVHFDHNNPLQWFPVHQARASHANHASTSDCVRRAPKKSDRP